MKKIKDIYQPEIDRLVVMLAARILATKDTGSTMKIYPIPRGGVPVVYALLPELNKTAIRTTFAITEDVHEADFFVDDLIDSGATLKRYAFYGKPFFTLLPEPPKKWVTFPWERSEGGRSEGIENNITRILQYVGEDISRAGLLETPKRVAKSIDFLTSGYTVDIPSLFKTFEDGAENVDDMVIVKNIPFYSNCEHHLLPFFGTVTIAYIPNGKIVGLSKLNRLVAAFSRRFQVQERLTNQIAEAMVDNLAPIGVAVHINARHMCMESRGVCQSGHSTLTTAVRGAFKNDPSTRAEFMAVCS